MGQHHRVYCHAHPEPAHGAAHLAGTASSARAPARSAHAWLFLCFCVPHREAFRQGLRDLGYVEGRNITLEYRFAEGQADRLPALVAEMVRLPVDVLVVDGTAAIRPAQHATTTIPIVMAVSSDPVGAGLVASLARPGGNITGLAGLTPELCGKWLEFLKEAVPTLSRVATLWHRDAPVGPLLLKETQAAAQALGLQLQALERWGGLTSSTRPLPR